VQAELATASYVPVADRLEAIGTIDPWARVTPGTKILGRVASVPVREGERVGAGQVLAELEDADLRAAVDQAKAGLAMSEAQLENASVQHARIVDLHARGSVTAKNLEDATAAFRVAEAAVRQAEANLAAAEVTLGYARVRSPRAGWMTERRVEAGDMAAPGQPMFVVEDLSRVRVRASIPESDVVGLEPGREAEVEVDVLDRSWKARLDRLVPSGDARSRTYEALVFVDNDDGALKSGMFARVSFPTGSRRALLVPESAIVRRGALDGLFVTGQDGIARLRWVRLGPSREGSAEVVSGLDEGETYLPAPPAGLGDGTPVRGR
jgi:RND family efflux transporter MFP subunit